MRRTIHYMIAALLMFASISASGQLNKSYFFNLGRNHLAQEKYPEAITTLNQLIRADSTIAEAWFLRGVAKYYLNDIHGAYSDFSFALKHNPVFSQAYLYRAIASSKLSKFNQALPDFDAAIDLRPNSPDAYYSRGVAYLIMRNPERAISDLSKSIQLDSKNPDSWINRGTARLLQNDTVGALNDYRHAILLNPFYAESYGKRGRLYLEMKEFELALTDLTQAVQLDSTTTIHLFLQAIVYSEMGNRKEAIENLSRVIERTPQNALSLYNRGLLYWQKEELRKALSDFNDAALLNPDNVLIFYNRAVLLMEMDRLADAIADFTHTIELFPDFANAYLGRSIAYKRLGKEQEGHRDHIYAQSIAEKFSQDQKHPWSDTTNRFDNLIAFSTDFSTKTSLAALDEYDSKPIDILPFIRIIAIPMESLWIQNQEMDELNQRNRNLEHTSIRLTLGSPSSIQPTPIDTLFPLNPFEAAFIRALRFSMEGRFNQAIEEYERALSIDPSSTITLINLAVEKAEMTNFIASFDQEVNFVRMEQQPRTSGSNTKSTASHHVSFDDSHYILENASIHLPNHPVIIYNRANLFALSGQMERAIDYYGRAIALEGSLAEAWYNRGLIHLMQKDTEKGCTDMGKAGEHGVKHAYLIIHRFCK